MIIKFVFLKLNQKNLGKAFYPLLEEILIFVSFLWSDKRSISLKLSLSYLLRSNRGQSLTILGGKERKIKIWAKPSNMGDKESSSDLEPVRHL